jgi:hypothetical protein
MNTADERMAPEVTGYLETIPETGCLVQSIFHGALGVRKKIY